MFRVLIYFKQGPDFECRSFAPTDKLAKAAGIKIARSFGFFQEVKKVRVIAVLTDECT